MKSPEYVFCISVILLYSFSKKRKNKKTLKHKKVSKAICQALKLSEPDEKTHKILFYRMDISADGHVDFDEFFAYYRAHVINMLAYGCGLVD